MASRFTLKTKDSAPDFTAILRNFDETAIDLTNASSVKLWMKLQEPPGASQLILTATVDAPKTQGKIRVKFTEINTATDGVYNIEAKILWNDGTKESVPNDGYEVLIIEHSVE